MDSFDFYNPTKIHFGCGRLDELGRIAARYGKRCLLVTTPNDEAVLRPLYDRVKLILGRMDIHVAHFDEVVPNPQVQGIEKAIGMVKSERLDVIVAVGGGSSIDTAKAISLFWQPDKVEWEKYYNELTSPFMEYDSISQPVLPLIAVPTTAGTGSELTQAMIISDRNTEEKLCIFHPEAFPREAIIDPELTRTMPTGLTAITGFDAFAHSFESFMREEASIYTRTIGMRAMSSVIQALPVLVGDLSNMELRVMMSEAEMLSGISLSNAAASVPHPLSEIIGGINPGIPHGQALASLYPGYVAFQTKKTPDRCAAIARLFDSQLEEASVSEAARRLPLLIEDLIARIGLNKKLSDLGVTKKQMKKMSSHPVLGLLPFGTKEEMAEIMRGAF